MGNNEKKDKITKEPLKDEPREKSISEKIKEKHLKIDIASQNDKELSDVTSKESSELSDKNFLITVNPCYEEGTPISYDFAKKKPEDDLKVRPNDFMSWVKAAKLKNCEDKNDEDFNFDFLDD